MDHKMLADIAAKIAEIANDCFDRPAATRLRELYADLERKLATPCVPDANSTPSERAPR
jgi:hypothetical protein